MRSPLFPGAANMLHQPSHLLIAALPTLPGIDGKALQALFHERGLLGLYDHLVGGAVSTGSLFALGIMPYLSACIFMQIGRAASPSLDAWGTNSAGRRRLTHWTRVLTGGLALIQSYGFAQFALTSPGVVATPGPVFVIRTMTAMTLGALCMMWMGEQARASDPECEPDSESTTGGISARTRSVESLAAPSSAIDGITSWRSRSAEAVRVTPLPRRADWSDD